MSVTCFFLFSWWKNTWDSLTLWCVDVTQPKATLYLLAWADNKTNRFPRAPYLPILNLLFVGALVLLQVLEQSVGAPPELAGRLPLLLREDAELLLLLDQLLVSPLWTQFTNVSSLQRFNRVNFAKARRDASVWHRGLPGYRLQTFWQLPTNYWVLTSYLVMV